MRSTLYTFLLLLCIATVYVNGCQTAQQQSDLASLQDEEPDDQGLESEDLAEEEVDSSSGVTLMPHPKEASAWFTRKLIMTSRQPSADSINRCRERVESVSSQATNLRALQDVAADLESPVSSNLRVFHWCFYQMMSDLDNSLAADASLMDEKAGIFLARMKSLWALGRALDASSTTGVYMNYLRARYTEISQNTFGRRLESMSAGDFRLPASSRGKPAEEFDE